MIKTLPITQAREELTSLVNGAHRRLDEYVITVNGSPAAVLMSSEEFDSWKETITIASDPSLVQAIKEGEKEMENGEVITFEELKAELEHV